MSKKLYSLIAIFLSCFSSTYLSYIFAYAFYAVQHEEQVDALSPSAISITNVLWPSLITGALALICCWQAYRKQQGLRLLALIMTILVLSATLFFQQLLALVLTFY